MRKMEKRKKQTTEAPMRKLPRVAVQTQIANQDSDIFFMKDTDEEIDTGEVEEQDWIEKMKRSTSIAVERMKSSQNLMLD